MDLPLPDPADGVGRGVFPLQQEDIAVVQLPLAGVRLLALESNHDGRMLETGPYPYVVKQRIASARGHLSNAQAAEYLRGAVHGDLRHVVAMHISQENNTYRLPRETLVAALADAAPAVPVSVAYQDRLVTIA